MILIRRLLKQLCTGKTELLTEIQSGNEGTITFNIRLLQVLEHIAATTDHQQQTAVGMVIVLVLLQMLIQVVDALSQESDLHFRGTGVSFMLCISSDDFRLVHREPPLKYVPKKAIFVSQLP